MILHTTISSYSGPPRRPCPEYDFFRDYSTVSTLTIDNVYSWQECGNLQNLINVNAAGQIFRARTRTEQKQNKFQSLSLCLSGLRCKSSSTCEYWQWRNNVANKNVIIDGAPIGSTGDKQRKCILVSMTDLDLTDLEIETLPSNGYISGDQQCYEQTNGGYAGCYRQNVKWDFTTDPVNGAQSNYRNWGQCAEECKRMQTTSGCKYWTWSSSSCTNCIPKKCLLFNNVPSSQPETLISALGHISGALSCQDIEYVEEEGWKVNPVDVPRKDELVIEEGRCRREDITARTTPQCNSHEVPGYQ